MSMFAESLRAFLKPIVPLLDDQDVSEILINGPREVWIEKAGRLSRTDCAFTEEGLLAAARNMAQFVGRPLTEERPRLDARLPDGSRIHVVLGPVARKGTTISIRKFFAERLSMEKLVEFGSVTPELVQLLRAAIELRLNIVVAGGTGSGKTSLLNALSSMIAPHERILTIEDSAELQLHQPHIVTLESRPADKLGKGEINIGDLLHSALRLRPDRIVVGEVRGGECFYLLQAMNTGHGGTLTTAHANTPVDTLRRLESLCLLSGVDLPLRAVRAQVASAVHLVVCCERLHDGKRKVTSVAEALPLDEVGEYRVQELFVFENEGRGPNGEVLGRHVPTGVLPTFFPKLKANGIDLPASFFDPEAQGLPAPALFAAGLGARTLWAKDLARKEESLAAASAPPVAEMVGVPIIATPTIATPILAPPAVAAAAVARHESPAASPAAEPSAPVAARAPGEAIAEAPAFATSDEQTDSTNRAPSSAPSSTGKVRAPGAVRATPVATPPPPLPAEKKRAPAPSAASRPPAPMTAAPNSSIQLDPELAAEMEASLPYESTLITRNPLLKAQPAVDEDATNPGARRPPRK